MSIDWTRPRADLPPLVILDTDGVLLHLDLDRQRMRAEVARPPSQTESVASFGPSSST